MGAGSRRAKSVVNARRSTRSRFQAAGVSLYRPYRDGSPLTGRSPDHVRAPSDCGYFSQPPSLAAEVLRSGRKGRLLDYIPNAVSRRWDSLGSAAELAVAGLNPLTLGNTAFWWEVGTGHRQKAKTRLFGSSAPIGADSVFHQARTGAMPPCSRCTNDQGHRHQDPGPFRTGPSRSPSACRSCAPASITARRFDIAWQGKASAVVVESMLVAARYAPPTGGCQPHLVPHNHTTERYPNARPAISEPRCCSALGSASFLVFLILKTKVHAFWR